MTKFLTVVLACWLASMEAFSPLFQKSAVRLPQHKAFFAPHHHGVQIAKRTRNVARLVVEGVTMDVIFPCLILIATAAATVVKADQNDEELKTTPLPTPLPSVAVVASKGTPEAVAPAAPPIPATVPVIVPVVNVPVVKVPVVKIVDPVTTPTVPVSRIITTGKDISKLKMEIASTREGEKAKEARLEASMKVEQQILPVAVVETVEVVAVVKRNLFAKVLRILKKIIAPWRKWSTIQ
jgi:hypothetical protein